MRHGDAEELCSWRDLLAGALRKAAGLRSMGLGEGDRVVIVLNTSFEFIETFFGVIFAGCVPVPAYPPVAMSRLASYIELLAHIIRTTSARVLVTDRTIGKTLGTLYSACDGLDEIVDVDRVDGDPEKYPPVEPGPDSIGFIQCTSGSTAAPKGVVLLQRNLLANVEGMTSMGVESDRDVMVSWLPLYHDLGLIGAFLTSVCNGIKLVLLPPDVFLLDPGSWWRAVSRHRGTITGAPNFAYGLSCRRVDDGDLAELDLSCLRIALCGAEPIQPPVIDAFLARMAPAGFARRAFMPAYGLAESCVAVTMRGSGRGMRVDRVSRRALSHARSPQAIQAIGEGSVEYVSVGRPIPGTTLRVRDKRGQELPERHVGEVWISGPSVMAGYLDDPDATAAAIVGGELRSGDLGYIADGELFIVGRIKHMLIVRGKNYYAEDIETAVEQVSGVRKGNAVAFGRYDERRGADELQLVVETRLRDAEELAGLEEAIAQAVADAVGLRPAGVMLVPPSSLPKTSSGKKRRNACRDLVEGGELVAGKRPQRASGAMTLVRSQVAFAGRRLRRLLPARQPKLSPTESY